MVKAETKREVENNGTDFQSFNNTIIKPLSISSHSKLFSEREREEFLKEQFKFDSNPRKKINLREVNKFTSLNSTLDHPTADPRSQKTQRMIPDTDDGEPISYKQAIIQKLQSARMKLPCQDIQVSSFELDDNDLLHI